MIRELTKLEKKEMSGGRTSEEQAAYALGAATGIALRSPHGQRGVMFLVAYRALN